MHYTLMLLLALSNDQDSLIAEMPFASGDPASQVKFLPADWVAPVPALAFRHDRKTGRDLRILSGPFGLSGVCGVSGISSVWPRPVLTRTGHGPAGHYGSGKGNCHGYAV